MKQKYFLIEEGNTLQIKLADKPEGELDWVKRIPHPMNLVILYAAVLQKREELVKAASQEILSWSVTQNTVSFYMERMFNQYGMSRLKEIYESVSKEDFRALVISELYGHIRKIDLSKYKGDLYDMSGLTGFYKSFLSFVFKDCFITVLTEIAKEKFPQINRNYLKSYARMRKLSGYTVDLDWETEDIVEFFQSVEGCPDTLRSEKHIRNMKEAFSDNEALSSVKYEDTFVDDDLQKAVNGLSEIQRAVIADYFFRERTVRDIATELNISEAMVYFHKKEALNELRKKIA